MDVASPADGKVLLNCQQLLSKSGPAPKVIVTPTEDHAQHASKQLRPQQRYEENETQFHSKRRRKLRLPLKKQSLLEHTFGSGWTPVTRDQALTDDAEQIELGYPNTSNNVNGVAGDFGEWRNIAVPIDDSLQQARIAQDPVNYISSPNKFPSDVHAFKSSDKEDYMRVTYSDNQGQGFEVTEPSVNDYRTLQQQDNLESTSISASFSLDNTRDSVEQQKSIATKSTVYRYGDEIQTTSITRYERRLISSFSTPAYTNRRTFANVSKHKKPASSTANHWFSTKVNKSILLIERHSNVITGKVHKQFKKLSTVAVDNISERAATSSMPTTLAVHQSDTEFRFGLKPFLEGVAELPPSSPLASSTTVGKTTLPASGMETTQSRLTTDCEYATKRFDLHKTFWNRNLPPHMNVCTSLSI
jgi:hypothetical protein